MNISTCRLDSCPVVDRKLIVQIDNKNNSCVTAESCPRIEAFRSHWNQIKAAVSAEGLLCEDTVHLIFNHVDQLIALLISCVKVGDEDDAQARSALRQVVGEERVFDILTTWCVANSSSWKNAIAQQLLKVYETLVSQSAEFVICFRHVFSSLPYLCQTLLGDATLPRDTEECVVFLMHQVCTKMVVVTGDHGPPPDRQHNVFFDLDQGSSSEPSNYISILKLMVPFLFREDRVGQLSRDSLLFVLANFSKIDTVVSYVADESNFCPV
ncbi:unnamed protein product [Soboliphyme baturini]|uniref:LINES_N domain-containing protein n=1 Tax=Soboliphyme baturini TaxID=241478 RepID=A0A183IQI7_9BILA|nr:unnamed protein product [Soboliphyme baturini]